MHSIEQLEKQQVGLRLPRYLVEEIDEFTKKYSVNRTDIIIEAIKSYINEQKAKLFYDDFENAARELRTLRDSETHRKMQTLDELIDELEDH
jgi:metal-responsive CopG/Arc/MetJ family transcriptional regulator